MNTCASKRGAGCVIAAMVFLFAFSTSSQAAVKKISLNTMLKSSGITLKIERLDRMDGFLFGLTFKGSNIPTITLAPGFGRMLLVQIDGADIILQGDGTGKIQIIQAEGDIGEAICVLDAVIDFLRGMQTCLADPVCLFKQIFILVTDITACSAGTETPAE
ncbi:MAG: hypothetical protein JW832_13695 [Deltaproteobacteria bacterium]|nr:hypothetical protein [Deltaproteobacteria bacterium]